MVKPILGAALLAAAAVSFSQNQPEQRRAEKRDWGISVGVYFPVDEEVRDQFGNGLLRIGISPISKRFDKKWDISTDVNLLWAKEDSSRLFLFPVTVGATLGTGDNGGTRAYISANVGPAYYDYRLFRVVEVGKGTELREYRKRKVGWNANVEVGTLINERFAITGRYDWYQKSDGFDFSGFSVNVNIAFFKW